MFFLLDVPAKNSEASGPNSTSKFLVKFNFYKASLLICPSSYALLQL